MSEEIENAFIKPALVVFSLFCGFCFFGVCKGVSWLVLLRKQLLVPGHGQLLALELKMKVLPL